MSAKHFTEAEAAEHVGVCRSTWRSYVARDFAPAPVGFDPQTGYRVWGRREVERWTERRPGSGDRTKELDAKAVAAGYESMADAVAATYELSGRAAARALGVTRATIASWRRKVHQE